MGSNIYRHAYVCIVFPSDHKQYTRTQERFFTAYSCCNKLHFMGKLRFFQKKKDWPIVVANLPGVVFGAIAAATAL